jgi:glutamate decarboxylase
VSRDLAALLLEDMQRCFDYFEKHPITNPMDADEASGFHH